MSFDKHYPNRKDHRHPYRGAKRYDRSCRPNGSCDYCRNNRLHADRRQRAKANDELNDWRKGDDHGEV